MEEIHNTKQTSLSNQMSHLSSLDTGQTGVIKKVESGPFTARLRDLGFTPGSSIECRQKAPFGGPVEFEVRGSRFCLRQNEIQLILITPPSIH